MMKCAAERERAKHVRLMPEVEGILEIDIKWYLSF
jgi:hypothetical protein